VLFVIDCDPRSSGRAAEAIRIAAGVGVWKRIEVSVYLRDAAVMILSEDIEDLVDSDNFFRYLPVLAESARPIYVQKGSRFLSSVGEGQSAIEEISDDALARLAAEQSQVIRF
jgi:hypothetical protein